ncbi:MAG: RnfABCDGE type electron transport complex subunit D [Chthoniobacter sp.]|nr:RnfABCDGE type electron transport complex subunit D [Chthoniobacter sp.]
MDPRLYQIAALAGLLIYGLGWLDFEIGAVQAAVTLAGVLGTQWACSRLWKVDRFDPRSALISGLSLCLLLRTNHLGLALAAAVVTIASKFVLRWRGKHLFNPTNLGLVVMMLATDSRVWVSPGQWGNVAFFAFLMVCLGGLVVMRAARSDVTLAFLACYLGLVIGRTLWLGEPLTIPLHRLQSGALLLFAFFMISDPKTTPDSRAGRILFAALVAWGAWYVQFRLFRTNGLLWSLAGFSCAVPLIDWLLPGVRYRWESRLKPKPAPAFSNTNPQPALP